ncbi:hypothetical protein HAX54_041819, partial [Datura stramonium]|nr:hypothetical protein [Datura stramonium]
MPRLCQESAETQQAGRAPATCHGVPSPRHESVIALLRQRDTLPTRQGLPRVNFWAISRE